MQPGCGTAKGEAESAKEDEREDAEAGDVSGFAEHVVDMGPVVVDGSAEEELEEAVQRRRGMVGPESGCGFDGQ
jgi:hypothetical protein